MVGGLLTQGMARTILIPLGLVFRILGIGQSMARFRVLLQIKAEGPYLRYGFPPLYNNWLFRFSASVEADREKIQKLIAHHSYGENLNVSSFWRRRNKNG